MKRQMEHSDHQMAWRKWDFQNNEKQTGHSDILSLTLQKKCRLLPLIALARGCFFIKPENIYRPRVLIIHACG
jgi:hypothetical protein